MPRILRILNRLNVGGPTLNAAYLSKYLNSSFQTKLLAGVHEPHEKSSEYILKEVGFPDYEIISSMQRQINLRNDIQAYRTISGIIKEYKPDIVHTHAAKAGAVGRMAAHFSSVKPKAIIHTYHGNVFDGYFSPAKTKLILVIERQLCTYSNAIIAISELQKKDLVEKYKIAPAEKIHVVPLGFDLKKFCGNNALKRKAFRSFYNISDEQIVITITGRIASVKNHQLFIEAIAILYQFFDRNLLKIFIVGDGELMPAIVQQLKELNISFCLPDQQNFGVNVIFTSWREDMDYINAGSDIAALTSVNEGTPVSLIEAMAAGKPVVSTNVGGVADVVLHKSNGLLVNDFNAKEFAEALLYLIQNKEIRSEWGTNGTNYVLAKYTHERLINDMTELYEQLLN